MLDQAFQQVYTKFKLHFYQQVFSKFENREATLTTVESFCMEVIVALHTLGAVRKPNGTPVTFKDLVRAFERFLNVSILNPDRCRYTTINRKLHLTKFLDTMREALVELSQR